MVVLFILSFVSYICVLDCCTEDVKHQIPVPVLREVYFNLYVFRLPVGRQKFLN
jgi:hypothetical protein